MRSPWRVVILVALLLLSIGGGYYLLTTPGSKPVVISVYEPPIVSVARRIQDVGQVETDSKATASFLLYNIGGRHLRITDVETSCGCTLAKVSKHVVAPGDFSTIKVALDTSIKIGPVRKKITVHSNDPARPQLALFLTGEVLPKKMMSHEPITVQANDRLVLFKGECATCHVDAGRGKTGKALFLADCAMCHGVNAQGNHTAGPTLLTGNYDSDPERKRLRKIIAEGSPYSPQMPPFSKAHGGPLTEDEIDSLMGFLKFQTMQHKMGLLEEVEGPEVEDEAAFQEALKQPH